MPFDFWMVRDFQKDITGTEYFFKFRKRGRGAVRITGAQMMCNVAGKRRQYRNKPFTVLTQQFFIHARTFKESFRP